MSNHDESLIDKVKNALGMGEDDDAHEGREAEADATAAGTDERAEGWAGVPEALYDDTSDTRDDATGGGRDPGGLGENPGPVGSARYEGGETPDDFGGSDVARDGDADTTREDRVGTEFGGAYGEDDTPMPTSAAWDRGEAPPGEASFGTEDDELNRRETGI